MTTVHENVNRPPQPRIARRRPWPHWLLTAAAFPPAGYVGHLVAGPVDTSAAAIVGGVITGAGIGAAQWSLLRRRGIGPGWIVATAIGLAGGGAAGAAFVSYRTDLASLAAAGAITGAVLGAAQAFQLGRRAALWWALLTSALWALGWTVTTSAGISVEDQFVVFGITGALVVAWLQSTVIDLLVPRPATTGSTKIEVAS